MYTRVVDTRDRLVESARELLWERGYVGTSPKAIQQRAGVGQGSMYHHFSGKPDLAVAAVERSAAELRAAAGSCLDGPGSALARITAYLRRQRDVLKGCPIGRMTQDPDVVTAPELRQPLADAFTWLRDRLTELVDDEDIATSVLATLQGGYVLARAAGSVEPFDQAINGILVLLARVLD
jgi:TetR/AcrR family transcriptional repressor of nem operon